MKIWQVTENDTQMRFYWFATKREAEKHSAQYRKDMIEAGEDTYGVEIEAIEFPATRAGLAKALNFVISLTCFNEG